ncbi:hypothetical protein FHW67_003143 [Herbaspirillum sp. Sphag1AN]|uniref:hypothetical protein n=1 Tax=unclassified Herbaspirillum TaxID=2624150 RepID=UPI0016134C2F|nr:MULTISPECIES: hypothetical protein [unclassified Herbaspirillum]MBB3213837.1 hypothetical protein [Herbaspirillum sp. Sphag1AN]MBB3247034.1 hypothetical protein [Herbaspirillum sp. Sphag64]
MLHAPSSKIRTMIKHASLGSTLAITLCLLSPADASAQQSKPECQIQAGSNFTASMCLTRAVGLEHDLYSLIVDKALIFTLTDDFSEDVHLKHTIPPGMTLEHPLSKAAGTPTVEIIGGCVPQSKDGMEVARLCNFRFGPTQVIKDVRFTFE